jgi:hypothetical protein
MKRFFKRLIRSAALLALVALAFPALAQIQPLTFTSGLSNKFVLTNGTFLLGTNAVPAVQLWQGRGISVQGIFGGTAEFTTGKVCLRFTISYDGTNYLSDTNQLPYLIFQPEGVKPVFFGTNFPPSAFDNATYIKLHSVTNVNAGGADGGCTCVVGRITNFVYIKKN